MLLLACKARSLHHILEIYKWKRLLGFSTAIGMQRDKDKETHSVDIQFDNRHSQTFSTFFDDVHSENPVHVSSTNKELKYFL